MEHDGRMASEPVADFKRWMVNHDYDPEHGKDMPKKTQTAAAQANPQAAPSQP